MDWNKFVEFKSRGTCTSIIEHIFVCLYRKFAETFKKKKKSEELRKLKHYDKCHFQFRVCVCNVQCIHSLFDLTRRQKKEYGNKCALNYLSIHFQWVYRTCKMEYGVMAKNECMKSIPENFDWMTKEKVWPMLADLFQNSINNINKMLGIKIIVEREGRRKKPYEKIWHLIIKSNTIIINMNS